MRISPYIIASLLASVIASVPSAAQRRGAAPPTTARAAVPAPLKAPPVFSARFETSKGNFVVQFVRDSAPHGVDRMYQLLRDNFFNDARFYRVINGFVAQFGIAADAALSRKWEHTAIPDDSVRGSNVRGTVSFAKSTPNSRTTQIFINLRNNSRLDAMGFAPIGTVLEGIEAADSLHSGYGETSAGFGQLGWGDSLAKSRNKYLDRAFPNLDRIIRVVLLPQPPSQRE